MISIELLLAVSPFTYINKCAYYVLIKHLDVSVGDLKGHMSTFICCNNNTRNFPPFSFGFLHHKTKVVKYSTQHQYQFNISMLMYSCAIFNYEHGNILGGVSQINGCTFKYVFLLVCFLFH